MALCIAAERRFFEKRMEPFSSSFSFSSFFFGGGGGGGVRVQSITRIRKLLEHP